MGVCALIALNSDRTERQENCKCLPDLVIETVFTNGFDENLVHEAKGLEAISFGHVAQNSDS